MVEIVTWSSLGLRVVRAGWLAGVVGGLLGCAAGVPSSSRHPLANGAFPPSRGVSLEGSEVRLPPAGQVTVVDVWSTFCEPCLRGMPRLQALWTRHRGAGLAVVGVAVDDNPGLVDERLRQLRVDYPNIVDASGSLRAALRADALPQTFVLDRRGAVRLVRVGGAEADVEAVEQAVAALLKE